MKLQITFLIVIAIIGVLEAKPVPQEGFVSIPEGPGELLPEVPEVSEVQGLSGLGDIVELVSDLADTVVELIKSLISIVGGNNPPVPDSVPNPVPASPGK